MERIQKGMLTKAGSVWVKGKVQTLRDASGGGQRKGLEELWISMSEPPQCARATPVCLKGKANLQLLS